MTVSPLSEEVIRTAVAKGMPKEVGDALTEVTVDTFKEAVMEMVRHPEQKAGPKGRRVLDLIFAGLLFEQGYL